MFKIILAWKINEILKNFFFVFGQNSLLYVRFIVYIHMYIYRLTFALTNFNTNISTKKVSVI